MSQSTGTAWRDRLMAQCSSGIKEVRDNANEVLAAFGQLERELAAAERVYRAIERQEAAAPSHAALTFDAIRDSIADRMEGHTISPNDADAWRCFLRLLRMVQASECVLPSAVRSVPAALWDEIAEFIEGQVDVRDSEDGPRPNTAMHLSQQIKEAGL